MNRVFRKVVATEQHPEDQLAVEVAMLECGHREGRNAWSVCPFEVGLLIQCDNCTAPGLMMTGAKWEEHVSR